MIVKTDLPDRAVTRVFVHCSASDNHTHDDVSVIRQWHLANGWADVGYHFFIKGDGTIQTGRPLNKTPAAQAPHNQGTIAICLHGLTKSKFTREQFESLAGLCAELRDRYSDRAVTLTFHGHCEVANKSCPVFDYRRVLGLDAKGLMTWPVDTSPQEAA